MTEGPTSPSWVFFVFAMIMIDRRASLPAAITVTICSSLVYFMLLAAFVPGPRNEYLMRSAYLAIICYLIGFIGAQRDRFEARVRDLEAAAERHAIAGTLHDDYVQVLAGVNLRLETCQALIKTGRLWEALARVTDVQEGLAREHDAVRTYIRSLAEVEQIPGVRTLSFLGRDTFQSDSKFRGTGTDTRSGSSDRSRGSPKQLAAWRGGLRGDQHQRRRPPDPHRNGRRRRSVFRNPSNRHGQSRRG